MLYTLTFSHIVEGQRVPLTNESGAEVTLQVEADSRTGAIYHETTKSFCEANNCSVRRVM